MIPVLAKAEKLHGLVIGINQYTNLKPLQGAVNDAEDIANALSSLSPANLILLTDEKATRSKILSALDQLEKVSAPGDTVIITYAGHGIQIKEAVDGQEDDGYDEAWALTGFSANGSNSANRIMDDELGAKLNNLKGRQIIFVSDSCHSGSMTRTVMGSITPWPTRFGGRFDRIKSDALPPPPARPDYLKGSNQNEIYIGGVTDDRTVPELPINGQVRGALSYYFSKAIRGAADTNKDSQLSVTELETYLVENVRQVSESQQTPVFSTLKAQDSTIMGVKVSKGSELNERPVALKITQTKDVRSIFAALQRVQEVKAGQADIHWDFKSGQVFGGSGDLLGQAKSLVEIQGEIHKQLALRTIRNQMENRSFKIGFVGGAKRRVAKEQVTLEIEVLPGDHLTVFNLASTGKVQMLYPINRSEFGALTKYEWNKFVFPPFEITEPFGADHIVAIRTKYQPDTLRSKLMQLNSTRSPLEAVKLVADELANHSILIGLSSLFTHDGKSNF